MARRMYFDLVDIVEFIKESWGKILFFIGMIFLVLSLLFLNRFGSLESAFSLFFGLIFVAFSMFSQLDFFSVKLRSLTGLGTILICISVVFLVFSIAAIQFVSIESVVYVREVFRGVPMGFRPIVTLGRPYAGIGQIFMQMGVLLFIVGIVLKVFRVLKP